MAVVVVPVCISRVDIVVVVVVGGGVVVVIVAVVVVTRWTRVNARRERAKVGLLLV